MENGDVSMQNKDVLGNVDLECPDVENSEFDELEADEQELEGLSEALTGVNQLTELGNRAMQLGLIVGHGYHGGQYEILRQGEIVTLDPPAAVQFLQGLIQDVIQGAKG